MTSAYFALDLHIHTNTKIPTEIKKNNGINTAKVGCGMTGAAEGWGDNSL